MNVPLTSPQAVTMVARATGKDPREVQQIIHQYTRLHWGREPLHLVEVPDPLVPDCPVLGELVGLYIRDGMNRWVGIEFPRASWLAVEYPKERLHLVTTKAFRRDAQARFERYLRQFPNAELSLPAIARAAPGLQADRGGWPRLRATLLGVVTHVLYFTDKLGDGPSTYIHEFGEVSGLRPALAADGEGRLWLAGGNYTVPEEGITD